MNVLRNPLYLANNIYCIWIFLIDKLGEQISIIAIKVLNISEYLN
jgi:hypothetical protein